jgi:glycosyltransferase involved in cell wall biosynthesis
LYGRFAIGREFRPSLLVTSWDAPNESQCMSGVQQMHLRLIDPIGDGSRFMRIIKFLVCFPSALWSVYWLLHRNHVRVVNPHFPSLACLYFAVLRRVGLFSGVFLVTLHGLDILLASQTTGMERFLWRFILRSADAVTACSAWLASVAASFDPCLAQKLRVVHNGADEADRESNASAARGLPTSARRERIILNIGKFEHKKGHDVLLAAFKRLLAYRKDIRLVLVGGSGPSLKDVRRLIVEEGLGEQVEMHVDVPHDRIWQFFANASVFVLSSRIEPFGIVVLEAGLARVPVVASAVGGVPEIVADGVTGHLVPPDEPAALANGIADVLDDPAKAARMAEQLQSDVKARFNWERCYQGFFETIEFGRARADGSPK